MAKYNPGLKDNFHTSLRRRNAVTLKEQTIPFVMKMSLIKFADVWGNRECWMFFMPVRHPFQTSAPVLIEIIGGFWIPGKQCRCCNWKFVAIPKKNKKNKNTILRPGLILRNKTLQQFITAHYTFWNWYEILNAQCNQCVEL